MDTWRRQFRVNYTPEKERGGGRGTEKQNITIVAPLNIKNKTHGLICPRVSLSLCETRGSVFVCFTQAALVVQKEKKERERNSHW